jgi:hypothetical protein
VVPQFELTPKALAKWCLSFELTPKALANWCLSLKLTPKALANWSPGFEHRENPGKSNKKIVKP